MNCKNCKADCASKGIGCAKDCKGYIPKTNADCIRSMTDEELADFLDIDVMNCVSVALHDDSYECPDDPCECTECWLRWLREEATDN